MPKEIYLVKVGMTMTEGMVSEWYIPDGASVNKGEMLYALETEKVNLDVDAEVTGTVKQLAEVGFLMEPGDVVGYIFEPGEDFSLDDLPEAGPEAGSETVTVTTDQPDMTIRESEPIPVAEATVVNHKIKSSPAARRVARELGIDLEKIRERDQEAELPSKMCNQLLRL